MISGNQSTRLLSKHTIQTNNKKDGIMKKELREINAYGFLNSTVLPSRDLLESLLTLEQFRYRLPNQLQHILNLFNLVLIAGEELGLPSSILMEIANGVFTHDKGKLLMPASLFDGHNFSPDSPEYIAVQEHAMKGYYDLRRWNWFKGCMAGGHHNGYDSGYGLKISDPATSAGQASIIMIRADILESSVKPKIKPEDVHWILKFFSIADFMEKWLNPRGTTLKGRVVGNTPEAILRDRYPGFEKFVAAILKVCEEVRD